MSVALEVSSTVDVRCLNFSMQLCFWTWGLLMLGDVSLKTGPFWDLTTETNVLTFLKNKKLFARTIYIRLLIKIYHNALYGQKNERNGFFNSCLWMPSSILVFPGYQYLYNSHAINNPLNLLFCCYKKYIV